MLNNRKQCTLSSFGASSDRMYWHDAQLRFIGELEKWAGKDAPVIATTISKSVLLPLVRYGDIAVGHNFYDYVVFIARKTWKRLPANVKTNISKVRHRWNSSFSDWKTEDGEVLITGGVRIINQLRACGLLRTYPQLED